MITEPEEIQILDMRHGMICAQALTPRESLQFIEKAPGGDVSIKPSAEGFCALTWAKSSDSSADGADRVEVAHTPGTVLVRDSQRPEDARLALTPRARTGFVAFAAA
ncbi:DUF397 domain-containing protein [Streptomyces virginiae]|uniref:DUF397 domain-containing protein n=1 Tax=Streptomyces virginiae TaxID=1961 RepID=UPI002E2B470A|nr:DUF397 domain-containing protein [Streptomyces virginiae]